MSGNPVLVTGSNGFIGRYTVEALKNAGLQPVSGVRTTAANVPDVLQTGSIDNETNWSGKLSGLDAIIHLAARVHVMQETATDPLTEFRKFNVEGTLRLARSAAEQSVRRFVYVSSIGVNGGSTPIDKPFSESSSATPESPYAQAKLEAEQALWALQEETGLEVVVVRPPLVYGPDAPGNFAALIRLAARGIPLPFGGIKNRRTLVSVRNLADFLVQCVTNAGAKSELFLIGDGEDVSTSDILRLIGQGFGQEPRLLPVPSILMRLPLTALGRRKMYDQLWGSLRVDSSKSHRKLNWRPPYSTQDELRWTAQQYAAKAAKKDET